MPTALIAGIDISACASRPSSLRSHCTWLPRPGGTPCAMTSKLAAHRVAGFARLVDLGDHPLLELGVRAVQRRVVADGLRICKRHGQRIRHRRRADAEDVADDLGADLAQQLPGDGADGDARGGLARAGALEDVADVVVPVLDHAGEIGVAGPRTRDHRTIDAGGVRRRARLSTAIVRCQFSQSLFGISSAIGPPVVRPWRTPLSTCARSDSMAMRRPRP